MSKYHIPLLPANTYHVFNRAIGNEKLFLNSENYRYFLEKWFQHIKPVADTYCYSLLPNHFHFLLRVKPAEEITTQFIKVKKRPADVEDLFVLADFVMERISNCLNSYTKAFNKKNHRRGSLFMDFTRRTLVDDDNYFSKMIHYIHANAVQHGYCSEIARWKHCSYREILLGKAVSLLQDEVVEWFGDRNRFHEFHQQEIFMKTQYEP